ncbi:MAG: hypothetical protein M3N41_07710 [Acidobacteriota bacterium]|nr:hypothetical protein [Acidobacteriota bacterium]
MDLKSEIMRRVESLPPERQRQLLVYVEELEHAFPRGENGALLLSSLTAVLDDRSAAEMTRAIEAACEGIDPSEW